MIKLVNENWTTKFCVKRVIASSVAHAIRDHLRVPYRLELKKNEVVLRLDRIRRGRPDDVEEHAPAFAPSRLPQHAAKRSTAKRGLDLPLRMGEGGQTSCL